MKIFLIRHGESTSDVEGRYGGHYDDHLTGKGRSQSEKVAKKLADEHIEVIFSSPFHRAKETSEILAKEWKCPVKISEGMKERDRYAHLTGMKKSAAAKKHSEHVARLKDYQDAVDGGEDYGPFKERVIGTFEHLSSLHHNRIAIVCHGGPIGCIIREILGMGESKYIGKCAFFEIEKNGKFRLVSMENAELKK
ncbi:MAG: histidine phosphatase family protein [Candidatus Aenigmarchaeota archaeon]|nr:histidine phosphatase family protein [Candidatus Aenigmarchaeota archaeon]